MKRNFIGLFSGCGGADLGFAKSGFKSLGGFDINKQALAVHKKNLGGPTYSVDLSSFTWPEEFKSQNIDLIFSGAPCQGFSTAGNRNFEDPRNSLLLKGGQIAIDLDTEVFISENVMGSFAGKLKEYWDNLEELFRLNGYKTQFLKVNCLDIGMAQMRKRVLFFAWKNGPEQLTFDFTQKPKTLQDVIFDIRYDNAGSQEFDRSDDKFLIASRIKTRQKLCNVRGGERAVPTWDIPEVFGEVCDEEKEVLELIRSLRRKHRVRDFGDADPVPINLLKDEYGKDVDPVLSSLIEKGFVRACADSTYDLTMTFNGKYRRLAWDMPSPTVDTRFGSPVYFLHPENNRGFTFREAARIQGFSDDFEFSNSVKDNFKMIGNAVPPPLSELVAETVNNQIFNS